MPIGFDDPRVMPEPNSGCWLWMGNVDERGYGRARLSKTRLVRAHRAVYEAEAGPIPEGLHLDHLCRNTSCVNPAHLEPVTFKENIRRGWASRWADKKPDVLRRLRKLNGR